VVSAGLSLNVRALLFLDEKQLSSEKRNNVMKTIGAMLLLALGAIGLHHALNNPPTVEAASKAVANTEVNLKDAATITRSQATQLSNGLTAPDRQVALPQELADFNRSTERLGALRDDLCKDIEEYKTAYNTKLA
jgi:hypothetical protein